MFWLFVIVLPDLLATNAAQQAQFYRIAYAFIAMSLIVIGYKPAGLPDTIYFTDLAEPTDPTDPAGTIGPTTGPIALLPYSYANFTLLIS
jgi:hypothetical protein